MSAITDDVRPIEDTKKGNCLTETGDLIRELVEACQEALKLRALECYILTKKGLQPYEMQKYRDEAAGIEKKIRDAITKAHGKGIHPALNNENAGKS